MAGLRKAKKYDWNDSNLALFGSDTEKQVRVCSAERSVLDKTHPLSIASLFLSPGEEIEC